MERAVTEGQATAGANSLQYKLSFEQLVLTLGYRCNMVCKSCFIGDKLNDHATQLSYDEAVEIIERAARLQTIRTVAFVGGEPFIFYKKMLRIAAYIHQHYSVPLNVTTNGTFAKSEAQARQLLQPLHDYGLRWLMLSLDPYHLENMDFEAAKNCLKVSLELGIDTSVQIIQRNGAPGAKEYSSMMSGDVDVANIDWIENPCSSIGNAATMLNSADLVWHDEIPKGGCNAGEYLNIQPDGEIKPCCGAGLMAKRLSIGNAKTDNLDEVVLRAEVSALLNSLIAHQGPRGLAKMLTDAGRADLVKKHAPFTDACHACHAFMSDPECVATLDKALPEKSISLLASRILTEHGQEILREAYY